ncbi:MAG: DegT/DnrJ/EryC1/StrS family aminotransferase [Candidatus Jacksonbacteria bacterium]|nr:DegT/DnrJ/EryC1/StrS family aminotransferase [Candidatus Jacksonbacteria bacterium]
MPSLNSYAQKFNQGFYFFKGRVALYALLKALGIGADDEVIIQAFTCLAVPSAVLWLDAKPVFTDIDPNTYNIDASKVEEKITRRTKAIIAQHTYGVPAEMDPICALARANNLYVIEDACHAVGSTYKGKKTGFLSDAAFFSFGWGKPITCGIGGCVVVNNSDIEKKMKDIYGLFHKPPLSDSGIVFLEYIAYQLLLNPSLFWFIRNMYRLCARYGLIGATFSPEELDLNMPDKYKRKMPALQQKLVQRKIRSLQHAIDHRRWVASKYATLLSHLGIQPQKVPDYSHPVYTRYPILVRNKQQLLDKAQQQNIEIGDWYMSPIHPLQKKDWAKVGYQNGSCPVAEDVCTKLVHLPTYENIKKKDIARICDLIASQSSIL